MLDYSYMNRDLDELFSRGVGTFVDPDNVFRDKLEKKIKGEYDGEIIIKFGVDPTRPDIHLGHAVVFRKLRQFQDLGCKVIFLVGDFTAQIGDPTGKSKVRPEISIAEISANMKTFLDQVGKVLTTDPKTFSWITNSDWFTSIMDINVDPSSRIELDGKKLEPNSTLSKTVVYENTRLQKTQLKKNVIQSVSLARFISILRKITHSQLMARDMFQDRVKKGEELYMHEMMYPVLQGIDSAVLAQIYGACDMEVGGTDQTFNMLVGRDVMKMSKQPEQAVLSLEILPGLDGVEKMSKSLDNYVAITDAPSDMFGKIMSIPDSIIAKYFELVTYTPLKEVEKIEKEINGGKTNPRDLKLRLAHEVVSIYHGEHSAKEAEEDFVETFSNKSVPKDVETVKAAAGAELAEILISQGVVKSKSEWRRLVESGAVSNMEPGKKIESPGIELDEALTLRVGKHRFIRIEPL